MLYSANFKASHKYSGQAVLLVILGMAVVLTMVISVVSRSVTDVSITDVEEDSSKAFSAAEAGIEKLLIGESDISNFFLGNESEIESAQSNPLGEGQQLFDFNETYQPGDVITVWLVSHKDGDPTKLTCTGDKPCVSSNAKFSLRWSKEGTEIPAVEMILYYDTTGDATSDNPNFSGVGVKRFAFDPDKKRVSGSGGSGGNRFDEASEGAGSYFVNNVSFDVSGRPLFARIRVLYAPVSQLTFALSGGQLPSQGRLLVSKGVAGSATRQIEVTDYYRAPLGIFEAGLFSEGDLAK